MGQPLALVRTISADMPHGKLPASLRKQLPRRELRESSVDGRQSTVDNEDL